MNGYTFKAHDSLGKSLEGSPAADDGEISLDGDNAPAYRLLTQRNDFPGEAITLSRRQARWLAEDILEALGDDKPKRTSVGTVEVQVKVKPVIDTSAVGSILKQLEALEVSA